MSASVYVCVHESVSVCTGNAKLQQQQQQEAASLCSTQFYSFSCAVSVGVCIVCVCVCFSLQYPFPLPTASAAAAEHNKFLISFALYLLFFASITLQFLAQAKFLFPFFIAFPLSAYASSCIIPIVFCCLCCCFGSHFMYRLCVFVCLCCVNI